MTLSVTASLAYSNGRQVPRLAVSSSPSVSDLIMVFRTHKDGTRHQVLTDDYATLVGTWVGSDPHAPFNEQVTYTAEAAGQVSAASNAVRVLSKRTWLIHRTDQSLSVLVEKWMASTDTHKYAGRAEKSLVLNSKLPRARTAYPRAGESGTMRIECRSVASRNKVQALFADGGQILINTPYKNDDVMAWKWVQPDDLEFENPAGAVHFSLRYAKFSYEEVMQPDADVRVRTFDEVEAMFPGATLASMALVYSNFDNSRLDIRIP